MDNQVTALTLPDESTFKRDIEAINRFQEVAHQNLILGQDYGVIPGTGKKPTLLKPGAEKIAKLLGLADLYEIIDRQEDWKSPFFRYLIKCKLVTMSGITISEGLGECNSMESKYRFRWLWPSDVPEGFDKVKAVTRKIFVNKKPVTQYRVDNDDIYSQVNTILKMGKKRALVDAALSAGRLSNVFTQDIEDMQPGNAKDTVDEGEQEPEEKKPPRENFVNMEWLRESLGTLQSKKLKDWTNAAVIAHLNGITGGQAKSVSEAAAALNKEQAEAFVKCVQDTLQMA